MKKISSLIILSLAVFACSLKSSPAEQASIESFLIDYVSQIGRSSPENLKNYFHDSYIKIQTPRMLENLSSVKAYPKEDVEGLKIKELHQANEIFYVRFQLKNQSDPTPWYVIEPGGSKAFVIRDISKKEKPWENPEAP